jgi:hypothetical protein
MSDLGPILTGEIGDITPVIVDTTVSVVGALAGPAMIIAGTVAVVGITIGVFRRLMRG